MHPRRLFFFRASSCGSNGGVSTSAARHSSSMDEAEFRRVLQLFPVVRSRDYCAESGSKQSTSRSAQDEELKEWQDAWDGGERELEIKGHEHDKFWSKLKSVAERKVGAVEAERFCKAFQKIHMKLVYEELTEDAARQFINSS